MKKTLALLSTFILVLWILPLSTVESQTCMDGKIEVEVSKHYLGKVEKTRVEMEKGQLMSLIEALKNASSEEERLAILQEYNLIREEDIELYREEVEKLERRYACYQGYVNELKNQITFGVGVVNLCCRLSALCAVFGIGINIPLGLSLLTGPLNAYFNLSLPSIDLIDFLREWGIGGIMVWSDGILGKMDVILPITSSLMIIGFVGFCITLPTSLFGVPLFFAIYEGYAAVVFGMVSLPVLFYLVILWMLFGSTQ